MDLVNELVHALRNTKQRRGQVAAARKLRELLYLAAARRKFSTQPDLTAYELHEAFLAGGGMQAAVRLLTSAQQAGTLEAAELLAAACSVPEAAAELAAAGGVEPLVQLLGGTEVSRTRTAAVSALADAAGWSDAVRTAAAAAGCVPLAVAVFQEAAAEVPVQPTDALFKSGELLITLAWHHAGVVLASGAAAALVALAPSDPFVCTRALTTLGQLTAAAGACRGEAAAAIVAAGGLPSLVRCLRGDGGLRWPNASDIAFTVPQLAAGLLGDMAEVSPQLAANIEAAGAVTSLEWMLRNSTHRGERGWTATALANIRRSAAIAAADSGAAPEAADAPSAAAPRRMCAAPGCGNTRGLRSCGGCHVARYCSAACCKAHWREHKPECRRLQAEAAAAAAAAAEPEP
ncbi:hypothetical protein COHA_009679 [Chlorella ohadii]|uniref:MYND-type domain-containing protein n=1 Tax=Chlorella ohadii TaxID=2649997 RepID=A0AAD5DE83_9CHLO|nr:hypothetical protein COHA_009679 [Chlorella ohadii]